MPHLWRTVRLHGSSGNHHRHSHRQVSQPDAAQLGGVCAGSKLYGVEGSRAVLHRIWHLLFGTGHFGNAVWKPIDEQSLVYRANAATYRRSYLSSCPRGRLSGHWIVVGTSPEGWSG